MEKLIAGLMLVLAVTAPADAARKGGTKMGTMHVSSPAFAHGSSIPTVHTCDGRDASPPLDIGGVPEEAKSLVLVMDDPDAPVGTWVHWVVWNIPPSATELPENSLPAGSVEGRNSWKRNAYGGPCPPSGSHRYFFKLYALDKSLGLPTSADKGEVERAMRGHILAEAELMGTYKRR